MAAKDVPQQILVEMERIRQEGSFDWRDWAERFGTARPDLAALDEIRMFWEIRKGEPVLSGGESR